MCFDVVSATRSLIKYAQHRSDDPAQINALKEKLETLTKVLQPHFNISGFEHPALLAFTNEEPLEPHAIEWGLIPEDIKDSEQAIKIANMTLNARMETLFDKPSFKKAAEHRRCLIYLDAFYEHHHQKHQIIPYHISMKDESPMIIAGIWQEWRDPDSLQIRKTLSIVTTEGNERMKFIHNNPKNKGARMPAILHRAEQDIWLQPIENNDDRTRIKQLLLPFPEDALNYKTVRKLKGKGSVGDIPSAEDRYIYAEQLGLF